MITDDERDDLLAAIDNEGFDYAFTSYSSFEEIKDKKFHQLRLAYNKAQQELSQYIGMED